MKQVPANRYVIYFLLTAGALCLDLYSKHIVFTEIGFPNRLGPVLFDGQILFRLCTSFNKGALWGMGQGLTWLFALLSVVAVVFVLIWLFVRKAALSLWLTVSLSLITAGTLGNLWDRLGLHGYVINGQEVYAVRDFLLFTFRFSDGTSWSWPVFNFADMFLVTGAVMLVVQSFRQEMRPQSQSPTAEPSSGTATGAATKSA